MVLIFGQKYFWLAYIQVNLLMSALQFKNIYLLAIQFFNIFWFLSVKISENKMGKYQKFQKTFSGFQNIGKYCVQNKRTPIFLNWSWNIVSRKSSEDRKNYSIKNYKNVKKTRHFDKDPYIVFKLVSLAVQFLKWGNEQL